MCFQDHNAEFRIIIQSNIMHKTLQEICKSTWRAQSVSHIRQITGLQNYSYCIVESQVEHITCISQDPQCGNKGNEAGI